jgi:hypothetical protein
MKLGILSMLAGVLVGGMAVGAAWASGAARDARPSSREPVPASERARLAAFDARLTRIERTLARLAAREVGASDASSRTSTTPPALDAEEAADDGDTETGADNGVSRKAAPLDPEVALQALYTSIERRLDTERPDPAWRPEPAIQDVIRSLSTRPRLVSTSCGSTLCRVELEHRTLEDGNATAEQIIVSSPFSAGTLYRHDPEDPLRLVLYVQRPGHAFEEADSLASPPEP